MLSTTLHPISIKSILLSSSHLYGSLPSGVIPSGWRKQPPDMVVSYEYIELKVTDR
jgi:hypothetical protein